MKIVLTHPFCWPYVRRGSERILDNIARYLVRRGHEVITLSTHPQGATIEHTESGTRILSAPFWTPALGLLRIQETHTFFFPALRGLRKLEPDVVHSFFFTDSLAASCARRQRKHLTIFQMNGIALPGISCRRFPPEAWMWRQTLRRVDVRVACSQFIGNLLRDHYGEDFQVVTPPTEIEDFPLGAGPLDGRPTILSAGDFTVPRKGVRVLVKAFRKIKDKLPDAVLRLSGRMTEELQKELVRDLPDAVRRDIQFLGLGKPGDVASQFREASILALPAMWEPSGTVMFESWASGTPVVATNHGGLPEFVTPGTGVMFDPKTNDQETANADGLADALIEGLELSRQSGVRERCRRHAGQFSTATIGAILEDLYAGGAV